jgi:hypothetical protein
VTRPTPAQARLLRALDQYPYVRVLWNGRQAELIGPKAWAVEKQLRQAGIRVKSATVRAVTGQGWLVEDETMQNAYMLSETGREALEGLEPDDFRSAVPMMTAEDVKLALRRQFSSPTWFYAEEVHLTDWETRRLDVLALLLADDPMVSPAHPLSVWAFEVKVSRADFLAEVNDKGKSRLAWAVANYFAFAAPAGLILPHELPDGAGLFEVHGRGRVVMAIRPRYTRADPPDWKFIGALMRAHLRAVAA